MSAFAPGPIEFALHPGGVRSLCLCCCEEPPAGRTASARCADVSADRRGTRARRRRLAVRPAARRRATRASDRTRRAARRTAAGRPPRRPLPQRDRAVLLVSRAAQCARRARARRRRARCAPSSGRVPPNSAVSGTAAIAADQRFALGRRLVRSSRSAPAPRRARSGARRAARDGRRAAPPARGSSACRPNRSSTLTGVTIIDSTIGIIAACGFRCSATRAAGLLRIARTGPASCASRRGSAGCASSTPCRRSSPGGAAGEILPIGGGARRVGRGGASVVASARVDVRGHVQQMTGRRRACSSRVALGSARPGSRDASTAWM